MTVFTNKKREGINSFVCAVSLYVAETHCLNQDESILRSSIHRSSDIYELFAHHVEKNFTLTQDLYGI